LRDALSALPQLQILIASAQSGDAANAVRLQEIAQHLLPTPGMERLLSAAIDTEPAVQVRDGGVIANGYDAELDELRGISTDNGTYLLELEARERARTGISTLRVEFNRVHGFFIEVSRAQSEKVPEDYRRRQTLKNAERYITPELKSWEDKVTRSGKMALRTSIARAHADGAGLVPLRECVRRARRTGRTRASRTASRLGRTKLARTHRDRNHGGSPPCRGALNRTFYTQ
jgi:DNA mismatch repair ATPase MutS